MSVDIRASTDLMLRATEPRRFARFITSLCSRLKQAVFDHHGVFDKFTGDGILAFFPDFHSGKDAGFVAVQAADACHQAFKDEYRAHRSSFTCVRADAGLGIGIDYGRVALVSELGSVTVVGTPVVYACRLGGARAGETLLNEQAYSEVVAKYSAYCNVEETTLPVKNESPLVAHRVSLSGKPHQPERPSWAVPGQAEVSANSPASGQAR